MENKEEVKPPEENNQAAAAAMEPPASEANLADANQADTNSDGAVPAGTTGKPLSPPQESSWLARMWAGFLEVLTGSRNTGKEEAIKLLSPDSPAQKKEAAVSSSSPPVEQTSQPEQSEAVAAALPAGPAAGDKKEEKRPDKDKEKDKNRGGSWYSGSRRDQPFRPRYTNPRIELLTAPPKVIISAEAYKRMLLYVEIGDKEVGWLGTVKLLPSGNFFIDQTYLLDQEVTPTETELSTEGLGKLMEELINKGGSDSADTINRLRFWGHSHVRMGVSPSGTDENTMRRFGREGIPWYIRGIFNKVGDAQFAIYRYEDGYRILEAAWEVWDPNTKRTLLTSTSGASSYSIKGSTAGLSYSGYRSSAADDSYGESAAYCYLDPNPARRQENVAASPVAAAGKEEKVGREAEDQEVPNNEAAASGPEAVAEKPRQPVKSCYQSLPKELIPDAELRAEVEAEFRLKVREKKSWGSWHKSKPREEGFSGYGTKSEAELSSRGTRVNEPNLDDDESDLIAMLEGFDVTDGGSGSGALIPKDDSSAARKKAALNREDSAPPQLSFIDRICDSIIKFFNEIFSGGTGK